MSSESVLSSESLYSRGSSVWKDYSNVYDLMDHIPFVKELRRKHLLAVGSLEYLLDNGCGSGSFTLQLAQNPGRKIVGIDFSKEMLAKAAGKLIKCGNVNLCAADSCYLPFADSTFDAVVSNMVIYLLNDAEKAVSEMARVTKPNGILSLASPLNSLDMEVIIEATRKYFEMVDNEIRSNGRSGISQKDIEEFIASNRAVQKRIRNLYSIGEITSVLQRNGYSISLADDADYLNQVFFVAGKKEVV